MGSITTGLTVFSKADLTLHLLKVNVKSYTSQSSYSSLQEIRDLVHRTNTGSLALQSMWSKSPVRLID